MATSRFLFSVAKLGRARVFGWRSQRLLRLPTALLLGLGLGLGLSACGSTAPTRVYSLSAPLAVSASPDLAPMAASQSNAAAPTVLDLLPVQAPERLQRPHMVLLGTAATASSSSVSNAASADLVLEQSRWAANLPDEVRDGLMQRLLQPQPSASAAAVQSAAIAPATHRIQVQIVRWEARLGAYAAFVLRWSVQALAPSDAQAANAANRAESLATAAKPLRSGRSHYVQDQPVPRTTADFAQAARLALDQTAADIRAALGPSRP